MLMEIYLSKEKAKKNNIDLNECYQKIDKYFKSRGVEIVSKGIYKGVRKDFGTFVTAQMQLPDTKWFLKIVDQWYISYPFSVMPHRRIIFFPSLYCPHGSAVV